MPGPRIFPLNRRWLAGFAICFVAALVISSGMVLLADEAADEAAPPAPGPAEQKLWQGLLRDLFGGRRPRGGLPPKTPQPPDEAGGPRDPIDSRAPREAKTDLMIQTAENAVSQKNWKTAVDLCQRVLDQAEDSLHRTSGGQWQSIHRTANQLLGQMPEAVLAEYRSQYGGLAQRQLAQARRSGQSADYVQVATRFFHTPAGYEAAYILGAQHFDRSEFGLAARWFQELAETSADVTRNDSWLLQAALASARAGKPADAEALLARLSRGTETTVTLPTGSIRAADWLSSQQGELTSPAPALEDWTQLYGTVSRVGTAVGGDAILSPNWSIPLTTSHTVRNSVKWLVHDLQDQQRGMIMASLPLVVGGRVLYRDLRGVRCVDLESGHTLWESVEGVSPERIIGGLPSQQIDPQDAWRQPFNPFQNNGDYQGLSAEYSPLASLLFRDGTYGLISSDGKQLFVIEEQGILTRNQPGQQWGWDGNADQQDPYGLPWKTNRLVSYDLNSGRMRWNAGGIESKESFDLPMAGCYFYGTPAVEGEELFVVAGKGDDIRLWSLDRRTGRPNWSQLIAYSDTKIDVDLVRRWSASQVSVGQGIIICPTTVGWLVGIDRMRQSVLWAYRYLPRNPAPANEREPGSQVLAQRELNATWSPSAPIIAGSSVVYAPPEEPVLFCLNAVDGRKLWEKPKERGLYLAGVFDKHVVIVGETGVTSLDIATGQTEWSSDFDEGIRPSGRGVAVGDRYYVPLSNGELRSIALANGEMRSQTFVASRQPPLGNLAMHHGKLVSLGTAGLTAFGQRDALLAEIDRRLQQNPQDAWALLRSSEVQLLNHQYAEALPLLRRIQPASLSDDERARHHAALVECLSTLIHADVLQRTSELDELGRLAESSAERLQYHELTAELRLAEQNPLDAFEIFARLASQNDEPFVVRTDDRQIRTRRVVWLGGRMWEIWQATPDGQRGQLSERIQQLVQQAAEQSAEACENASILFAFHPAAITARERLVEWLVQANDLSGARIVLEQLMASADKAAAGRATDRIARLMLQSQLPADAVYYYRRLEANFGDQPIRDGLTGRQLTSKARAELSAEFEPHLRGVTWKDQPLRLEQSVVNYSQPSQEILEESRLPYFSQRSMELYQGEQRISLESTATGQVDWMIPLRSTVRGNDEGYLSASQIGHQIYFVNRGVLHAISPIERRVLWCKSLDDADEGSAPARHANKLPLNAMIGASREEAGQSLLLQKAFSAGHLAIVQPNYLCVYGRRSLTVLDPRTGEELWTLEGLPINAQITGHRDAIFAVIPGKTEALVYRAFDGKPLQVPGVARLLNSALTARGSSFLTYDREAAGPLDALGIKRRAKIALRLSDPVEKVTHWRLELPANSVVGMLGDDEVVAVAPDGHVQRVDVASGRVTALESIELRNAVPGANLGEKYLLADDDRIYLIANSLDNGGQSYGESLASIRMNGVVFAWNRDDNKLAWKMKVRQQNLVVDRFAKLPVLLFVSRSWKPRGRMNISTLNIEAVNKPTGRVLIDSKTPSVYSGFHALSLNAQEPSIELKSYNVRMRLIPTEGAANDGSSTPADPNL